MEGSPQGLEWGRVAPRNSIKRKGKNPMENIRPLVLAQTGLNTNIKKKFIGMQKE
jgi:hypothetical protein